MVTGSMVGVGMRDESAILPPEGIHPQVQLREIDPAVKHYFHNPAPLSLDIWALPATAIP